MAASADGNYLAWTVNYKGLSQFHFRDLIKKSEIGAYRTPQGVIRSMEFAPDGSKMAFVLGSGTHSNDIWIYETKTDKLYQIAQSATGGIPQSTFREPELIEYKTFDGMALSAFWYTPADVTGKMPVIVMAHGGPEGQARPNLSGLIQYFLSRGYAVLEPNVRGSTGYGKSFEALDNVRKRMDSVKDLKFAAKWLASRKDVDAKKLVVFGGSYGGFMALSSLTTYPERWAAGVSIVGIANFVTFLEKTSGVSTRAQRSRIRKSRDR